MDLLANAASINTIWIGLSSSAALDGLEMLYRERQQAELQEEQQQQLAEMQAKPQVGADGKPKPAAKPNYVDPRMRRQDTRSPTSRDLNGGDNRQDGKIPPEDKPE